MFHVTIRAAPGTLPFRTWAEARALWDRLIRVLPPGSDVLLMPDHVHIEMDTPDPGAVSRAMRGYALWRNRRRREAGRVWAGPPSVTPIAGQEHHRRTRRYIFLNPCRKGLVTDPLAWPFSSYRDRTGLAIPLVRQRAPDVWVLHRYVSADPSVALQGTELPRETVAVATVEQVQAAVSQLTRTTLDGLSARGRPRNLFLRAAKTLTDASAGQIAAVAEVGRSTAYAVRGGLDPEVVLVSRVIGDPRFRALHDGDLRAELSWRRYSGHR